MKKSNVIMLLVVLCSIFLAACGTASSSDDKKSATEKPLVMVWYPNESGSEMKNAREEFGKVFEEATGQKVEHKLTTDYAIAIESIANGNADIAFMGPQGYIEARNKTTDVEPLVVPSGPSGTLDDAVYYSWLAVPQEKAADYQENGDYTLDKTAGKKISFVAASSTSGFKVPASTIVTHFGEDKITEEQLMEGNDVYPEVLFGDSHQGSAVNMLMERADIAAFCDTCVDDYVELADGEHNTVGATYKVKDNAVAPFNTQKGKEFTLIQVTPVLNSPFVVNNKKLSAVQIQKLKDALVSKDMTNNEKVFVPEGADEAGLFTKTADEQFLEVDDQWFEPIRELTK